jgi:hypothetical protein
MMGFAALYPSYDCLATRTAVVLAKAGTHNRREVLWREQAVAAEHITSPCGYGSRLKAGTTGGEMRFNQPGIADEFFSAVIPGGA